MKQKHVALAQRFALVFLAASLLLIVSVGCNTAHGFGEDVEKAGAGIQNGTK